MLDFTNNNNNNIFVCVLGGVVVKCFFFFDKIISYLFGKIAMVKCNIFCSLTLFLYNIWIMFPSTLVYFFYIYLFIIIFVRGCI